MPLTRAKDMSTREFFAALAMHGLLTEPYSAEARYTEGYGEEEEEEEKTRNDDLANIAREAVYIADALIAALNEVPG